MSKRIRPRRFPLKRLYISALLGLLGRAIPAASVVSPAVRAETACFPAGLRISLGVWPAGPALRLRCVEGGRLIADRSDGSPADLDIRLKSIAAAFLLFTFRESTAGSEAAGRLIAAGSLPLVLGFIRVIDAVETLLLPGFLARRAVKMPVYPRGFIRQRLRVYTGLVLPPHSEGPADE